MRRCFIAALALLLFGGIVYGAMTYDQSYYRNNRAYLGSATSNDPLYNLWGTIEGMYEGSTPFDAIELLESTGATYYTKIAAGNQSANLTLTLPTAYAAVSGYVLSSTDAGVLSWIANGSGTFAGGNISSDVDLSNGVDITSSTTTAHTNSIQVRDISGGAYRDVLRWTNGNTPAVVLGATQDSLAITSTGLNVSTAGAVTGVSTLVASGAVTATGGVTLQNSATITNGTSSEIALTSTGEDLVFDMDSASNVVGLKSSTGVNGIALGTVDDISGIGTLAFDAAASTVTLTSTGDAQDLTIAVAGANNSSLVLNSSGTAADALTIATSAGGIDITVAGAAAGEDIDITSNSSINLIASEAGQADAVVLQASGAGSGIDIISLADIDITTTGESGEDISLINTGGSILIRGNENANDVIQIDTTGGGGTTEAIVVLNDQGTGDASINIDSTAGGIDIDAGGKVAIDAADDLSLTLAAGAGAEDLTISLTGNQDASILIDSAGSGGDALSLTTSTNGGDLVISSNDKLDIDSVGTTAIDAAGDTMTLTVAADGAADDLSLIVTGSTDSSIILNSAGTGADAIKVSTSAGSIDIDAPTDKDVTINAGQVAIANTGTAEAGAFSVTLNRGTADTLVLTNTQGTDEAALNIDATAGGIDIDFATGKNMAITGGQFLVTSNESVAQAIGLTTNTGALETIVVTNSQGTDEGAITLTSTLGGIDLNAAALKDVAVNAGQILLTGLDNVANSIYLYTNTGTSETINITNNVGQGASAVKIASTAGGVDIDGGANADVSITSTGKSVVVTATEAASDGIALTDSTGAGGITLTGGTGGVNALSGKNVGAVVAGTCTAVEYETNGHHRTVLTLLTGATFDLEDKDDGNGIKIYDFPEGNVIVLGAFADVVVTAAAGVTGAYAMSVGTAAAADGENTLTSTEADFVASAAVTQGASQNFHSPSALTAAGLVMVPFDGTGGGKDVYLNGAVAAGNINAPAAITAQSGTIVIEWIYLGDY